MSVLQESRVVDTSSSQGSVDERPRFLSESECRALAQRVSSVVSGGGYTVVSIKSTWRGSTRWARNQVSASGEVLDHAISVGRAINGAYNGAVVINDTDTDALVAAVRRAERLAAISAESWDDGGLGARPLEPQTNPAIFSTNTYALTSERRSDVARTLVGSAVDAGMLSAGYIEVLAQSQALIDTLGRVRYTQFTNAQYTVTVRDPSGAGSGWAGVDWYDWAKIDGDALSKLALQKCLDSRNPVALEPGRYTAILEPQAVADLMSPMIRFAMSRSLNESPDMGPFTKSIDPVSAWITTTLGDRVIDERLTVTTSPLDPATAFPPFGTAYGVVAYGDPFENQTQVYQPGAFIRNGILEGLAYDRTYGIEALGRDKGFPGSGSFHMTAADSVATTSIAEMIASTRRGILVTRFDPVTVLQPRTLLCRGYTRDGVWLVENGKISKPIKNFLFTDSPLFALNKVEHIGVAQRVFHPGFYFSSPPSPALVPALKITDFSFTALSDAV